MLRIMQAQQDGAEWLTIYNQIKNDSSYKFMYSDIDTYVSRVSKLMDNDFRHPKITLKKHDHNLMLQQLKINFLKLIDDINMLDLHNLAICVEYVFDKLLDTLQRYFSNLINCIQTLNEQTNLHHSRYVYQSKCSQCQNNIQKNRVQSMMGCMTLAHHKPDIQEIHKINRQIDDLSHNYQDEELTILIDQILQRKQAILGSKNPRINNIYDQIAQYLENIPQATLNLSKQTSTRSNITQFQVGNFSEELEKNFGQMLRNPIKKLIRRILEYAKELYCKKKQSNTIATQSLFIKDEQNIKMLLKNNDNLKTQLDYLRKAKRQIEKDMVKMLDMQQKNDIKISQLMTQNIFLQQKLQCTTSKLEQIKSKLQLTETSKKQMSQKLIKDYTNQKAIYLKTIKQLQIKIQSVDHELMRLRKQTQNTMVSESIETNMIQMSTIQIQTDERMSGYDTQVRNSGAPNQSRKNFIKLTNFIRRSDNNDINGAESTEMVGSAIVDFIMNPLMQKNNGKKLEKVREERKSNLRNMSQNKNQAEQGLNLIGSLFKKRESIVEKLAFSEEDTLKENQQTQKNKNNHNNDHNNHNNGQLLNLMSNRIQRSLKKKNTQNIKSACIQDALRIDNQISQHQLKQEEKSRNNSRERENYDQESEYKRMQSSNHMIRSRAKLESSRMFISKPHCSPYIGSQVNFAGQAPWLEILEINNLKKQSSIKNQQLKQAQNVEKIKFISNLMQKYSSLKQSGLLQKISELVSLEQFQQMKINNNEQENIILNERVTTVGQKLVRKNNQKIKSLQKSLKLGNKTTIMKQNYSFIRVQNKLDTFTKNQVILLFGSLENAKKYQLGLQLWGGLQNSIMVDYNFMVICDNIELYLGSLESTQPIFYSELCQFLVKPYTYINLLVQKKAKTINEEKMKQFQKKTKHDRNFSSTFSSLLGGNMVRFQNKQNKSCSQLRFVFHKILRFHKIMHKKCCHVEQFLSLIGFKSLNK